MIYVLDTDILSLLGHNNSPEAPRIRRRIAELPPEHSVVTTILNFEEQMRGWMGALAKAKSDGTAVALYDRLLKHLNTYARLTVLGYKPAAAEIATKLKSQRVRIGAMDMKIASVVLAFDAILVTRNAVDFRNVPNLKLEDWSR